MAEGVSFIWGCLIASERLRLDRCRGKTGRPELAEPSGAMAGDGRSWPNKRFRARETKLKALERRGARCDLTWGREWDKERPARARDGERRTAALQGFQRELAAHREHENVKGRLRRLRKREAKLGKSLTVAKMRRSGGLTSAWISAAICG